MASRSYHVVSSLSSSSVYLLDFLAASVFILILLGIFISKHLLVTMFKAPFGHYLLVKKSSVGHG